MENEAYPRSYNAHERTRIASSLPVGTRREASELDGTRELGPEHRLRRRAIFHRELPAPCALLGRFGEGLHGADRRDHCSLDEGAAARGLGRGVHPVA